MLELARARDRSSRSSRKAMVAPFALVLALAAQAASQVASVPLRTPWPGGTGSTGASTGQVARAAASQRCNHGWYFVCNEQVPERCEAFEPFVVRAERVGGLWFGSSSMYQLNLKFTVNLPVLLVAT